MSKRFAKAVAALAALAGFALAFPVYSAPVVQPPATPSLVLPAADQETNAVWNNLRPNLTPPFSGQNSKKSGLKKWKGKSASGADGKYQKRGRY